MWNIEARKGVKETVEILSVNTILFSYRRCYLWLPPTSIHFVYRMGGSPDDVGENPVT